MKLYSFELYAIATFLMLPALMLLGVGCGLQNLLYAIGGFTIIGIAIWINSIGFRLEKEEVN